MCGIFGYLHFNKTQISLKKRKELLQYFAETQHRGPEHSVFKNITPSGVIGFHRLRIIDIQHGTQPFHNEEDYRKQGEKTFNLILNKARKQNARILSEKHPQFIRVKNIVDRLVDASHYRKHKDKVKYAVIDVNEFNALAFGGGYFVIFTGLMNQTNDDELAYVIAHELAHNTAGHIEENFFYFNVRNKKGSNSPP